MKYGEIWFVNFDAIDDNSDLQASRPVGHEYLKKRPALIIQSDEQLKITTVVSIMPMSKSDNCHKDDIRVSKSGKNRLFYDSLVKVHQIQTFDPCRFIHKIGDIEEEHLEQVKEYIKKHFGL